MRAVVHFPGKSAEISQLDVQVWTKSSSTSGEKKYHYATSIYLCHIFCANDMTLQWL